MEIGKTIKRTIFKRIDIAKKIAEIVEKRLDVIYNSLNEIHDDLKKEFKKIEKEFGSRLLMYGIHYNELVVEFLFVRPDIYVQIAVEEAEGGYKIANASIEAGWLAITI